MKLIFLFIFNSVDAQLMGQLCAQCTLQIVISVVVFCRIRNIKIIPIWSFFLPDIEPFSYQKRKS